MSLTKYQYPRENTKFVGISYPTYYTCLSDQYILSDFKYNFKLYIDSGLEYSTYNNPYKTEHLGVFNSTNIINNLMTLNWNPDIYNDFKSCKNSMFQYRVDVDEKSRDLTSPDTASFNKIIALMNYDENFDYEDYMLDGTDKKFLTNQTSPIELTLNQRATLRFLSGNFSDLTTTDYSYAYQIRLVRTDVNNIQWIYLSYFVNSHYGHTISHNFFSRSDSVLSDISDGLIDIGSGPYNVNKSTWTLYGYIDGGVYHSLTPTQKTDILECGDTYTITTYSWPNGSGGITSKEMVYKVVDSDEKEIQLMWENLEGGWDSFNFDKIYRKSVKNGQEIMKNNRYKQGHDINNLDDANYIGTIYKDREQKVYHQDIQELYTINTGYKTDDELSNLDDLWTSKNIFLNDDGVWKPVISTMDAVELETNDIKFKSFEINLIVSNQKII